MGPPATQSEPIARSVYYKRAQPGAPPRAAEPQKKVLVGSEWVCSILTSLRWIWNNCPAQIWVSRSKVQTQRVSAASSGLATSRCQKPGVWLMKESPCTIKRIFWGAFINTAPRVFEYSLFIWTARGAQWGRRCCTIARAKSICILSSSFWNTHEFVII